MDEYIPVSIVRLMIIEILQKHNKGERPCSEETLEMLCEVLNKNNEDSTFKLTKEN